MSQPLAGVRVIDLSMWWAGPFVTQLLGDLGAEIVKVESVQVPDGWRGAGMVGAASQWWERSSYFNGVNRNKFGTTLNLRDPRGLDLLRRLITLGDIIVENYTPRVMGNFGLAYEHLREIRPGLIMISLPAYGGSGPWRDYPGFAFPVEEMAGFPQLTGYADDSVPRRWGNAAADSIAGLNGAYAVLTALAHQRRTGEGQYIDLAQVETLACFLGEPLLDYQINGRLPRRLGTGHAAHAPHGVYRCAPEPSGSAGDDCWVAISVTDERQWQGLCACIDRPEWLTDARFANAAGRVRQQAALDEGIAAWTRPRDRFTVMRALQLAGVAAMPVMTAADLLTDDHLRARGYWQDSSRAVIGPHTHGLHWAHFSETPIELKRPAPTLGQHNESIFGGLLGLSRAELEQLARDHVIGTAPTTGDRM